MSRYLVNDITKVDSRAKLTTAVISNLVGLQALQKDYIQAVGDAGLKILKDTIICVGESIFKTERDITLNSANLDSGSFAVGKIIIFIVAIEVTRMMKSIKYLLIQLSQWDIMQKTVVK